MAKNWLSQSERDLITAKNCAISGDFYASPFFCHQTVEKCLKALYISRFEDLPSKTHHIDKLAKLLEAPDEIVNITYALSEDYMKNCFYGLRKNWVKNDGRKRIKRFDTSTIFKREIGLYH